MLLRLSLTTYIVLLFAVFQFPVLGPALATVFHESPALSGLSSPFNVFFVFWAIVGEWFLGSLALKGLRTVWSVKGSGQA
jgi:hypothetical protein